MRATRLTHKVLPLAAILLTAATALAVRPQNWNHQTEQDFADGAFENTIINSYGELTLGRELKTISLGEPVEMVVGLAGGPDGAMYAGTMPDARIFRIADGKAKSFYKLPESLGIITAVSSDAKGVLLGASSVKHGRLLRLDAAGKAKPATVFEKDGVESIWSILPAADGTLYVGTGPKAQVYKVTADGASTLVLEAGGGAAKNVVSLAMDKQNRLIAGTDGAGLVVRAGADGKPFVLHDAGAVDITALTVDDAGNIYAAASKGEGGGMGMGGSDEEGMGKSKPGDIEPEPMELPDDGGAKPKPPAKTRPGPQGLVPEVNTPLVVLADFIAPMPGTLPPKMQKSTTSGPSMKDLSDMAKRRRPPASSRMAPNAKRRLPMPHGGQSHGDESELELGNAVYKIAPDGSVTTVFTGQDTIMSLLLRKNPTGLELLVGTGTEGRVFSCNLADESQSLVARVKAETITALSTAKDGTIFLGSSNMGQVYTLSADLARHGTYTSKPLDANYSAHWGHVRITAADTDKGAATVSTRSGNVSDVEKSARYWSDWSAEAPASDDDGTVITSPKARYIQYRLTLKSAGDGAPTVNGVKTTYQLPNLPPRIKELTVESPDPDEMGDNTTGELPEPAAQTSLSWDATDPNHDALTYRVYYKPAGAPGVWTLLAKDLKVSMFDWTTGTVPDGKYQVKVIASDAADNSPEDAQSAARVSPPIVVDHTPPAIADIKAEVAADGRVTISGSAKDALSAITDVRIQVGGQQDWQLGKASDKIFDSLSEAFTATTRVLPPGAYRITVRVTDAAANSSYKAVNVTVK